MSIILPPQPNGTVIIKTEDAVHWHRLFAEAEKRIKEIEHTHQGLDIPSINELRYVAFHLLEILTAPPSVQDSHKPKLVAHIQRATYDACEALILFQLQELRKFREDYRLVVVSEVVKNYQDLMQEAETASALIQGLHRGHDGREEYYDQALKHVEALTNTNTTLRAAREELNKRLAIQRRDSRRWLIGTCIAGAAAIIALIIKFVPAPIPNLASETASKPTATAPAAPATFPRN